MIRDITIGQYYPAESVIHRLDPRVKLVGTLTFIISLFLHRSFLMYLVAAVFLTIVIKASKVPFRFMIKGLKAIMVLLLITVVFNMFLTPGTPLIRIWKLTLTVEGVKQAAFMAIRLAFLIVGSSVMTLTTTPNHLTDGMEKGLAIALRFIPILLEETDKIMKAQEARGADFDSGNLIQKAKSLVPLLVPLFISAFRRANDLAMAMEARGYRGGEGRTKMKPLIYQKRDRMAYGVLLGYLAVMILVGRFAPF